MSLEGCDRMDIKAKIKEWILPLAMLTGASAYLTYHSLPEHLHKAGPLLEDIMGFIQPTLIFAMLFLTFCRVEPKGLRPRKWHLWLLMIQVGFFTALGCVVYALMTYLPEKGNDLVLLIECAMVCLICPTATAAAVVTRKLGGDVAGITTYTILINVVVAVLVPLVVPVIHPFGGMSFILAFSLILAKIFPLLILPCLAAWLVRYLLPKLHAKLLEYPDLAFYIWTVALTLAIAMTVRYIVRSDIGPGLMALVGLVSLVCCAFQFFMGRRIGGTLQSEADSETDERVTAGQSLGQKNTVFAIWMGYTFLLPESAIAGGFYTLWHNLFNAWQLRRRK